MHLFREAQNFPHIFKERFHIHHIQDFQLSKRHNKPKSKSQLLMLLQDIINKTERPMV